MDPESSTPVLRTRRWSFRLAAVFIGLLPFVLLEIGFTIAGVGNRANAVDPFVEFSAVHPLFVEDQTKQQMVIASNRKRFFAHDEFPVEKALGTYRIFCLGGSTVQGRPYSIETSFTSWLQIGLEVAEPRTNWEVINCGGVSYASYRLLPILQECLNYQPDLLILCTGHNEFLEDRSYGKIKQSPVWMRHSVNNIARLRSVSFAAKLFEEKQGKFVLDADANAILDYKNGLAAYHRDQEWHLAVANHFDSNIRCMIEMCRNADVPLLLMLPPSNLSGAAPFKSESGELTKAEQKTVQRLKSDAAVLYRTDLGEAAKIWQEICRRDDLSAINHFELGRCLELIGQTEEARQEFLKARDLDVCPLRMTSPLEKIFIGAVRETKTPLLNLHQLLEKKTDNQILGDRWLVDHVHPNFEGHQRIALAIGHWLNTQGFIGLDADWETQCESSFSDHFQSLERTYFHKGQRALQGLRQWTQGDADGPPVEECFPHLLKN